MQNDGTDVMPSASRMVAANAAWMQSELRAQILAARNGTQYWCIDNPPCRIFWDLMVNWKSPTCCEKLFGWTCHMSHMSILGEKTCSKQFETNSNWNFNAAQCAAHFLVIVYPTVCPHSLLFALGRRSWSCKACERLFPGLAASTTSGVQCQQNKDSTAITTEPQSFLFQLYLKFCRWRSVCGWVICAVDLMIPFALRVWCLMILWSSAIPCYSKQSDLQKCFNFGWCHPQLYHSPAHRLRFRHW